MVPNLGATAIKNYVTLTSKCLLVIIHSTAPMVSTVGREASSEASASLGYEKSQFVFNGTYSHYG